MKSKRQFSVDYVLQLFYKCVLVHHRISVYFSMDNVSLSVCKLDLHLIHSSLGPLKHTFQPDTGSVQLLFSQEPLWKHEDFWF